MEAAEEWRPVVGLEGWYDISSFGRVRRVKPATGAVVGAIKKRSIGSHGYPVVSLTTGRRGLTKVHTVHRLVAEAFLGPPPQLDSRVVINHIDGDKNNSHVANLEWTTQKRNMAHALAMGLSTPTPRKLTDDQAAEIRALRPEMTYEELASRFNVSIGTIFNVIRGRRY